MEFLEMRFGSFRPVDLGIKQFPSPSYRHMMVIRASFPKFNMTLEGFSPL